jgi:peptidoglycan/xylan/chitin deacetylase (PgdA/CDA1 family)
MKADFFINTNYTGVLSNRMTWTQLRTLDSNPLFTVYSHTKSHPKLTEVSATQLTAELVESKQKIEDELGGNRNFLAYPFGDYDANVISATKQAGYLVAYAVSSRGSFGQPSQYSFVRTGIGKTVTTIELFKSKIGI